jgi:hypothetical protein
VANARVLGVRDLGIVRRVELAKRHRDRGIEAAIVENVSMCNEREKKATGW